MEDGSQRDLRIDLLTLKGETEGYLRRAAAPIFDNVAHKISGGAA